MHDCVQVLSQSILIEIIIANKNCILVYHIKWSACDQTTVFFDIHDRTWQRAESWREALSQCGGLHHTEREKKINIF